MSIITKNQIIAGAVARGWCHKPNVYKTMDVDLATAITDEVSRIAAPKQTQNLKQYTQYVLRYVHQLDDSDIYVPLVQHQRLVS